MVDDQLELRRLHHRQVGRLFAFENPPDVATAEAVGIGNARSVTDQPTSVGELAQIMDRWQRMACCQCDQLIGPTGEQLIAADDDGVYALLGQALEGSVNIT